MQSFRIVVGVDWADEKHAVFLIDQTRRYQRACAVEQTPEAIADWVASLRHRFPDTPNCCLSGADAWCPDLRPDEV